MPDLFINRYFHTICGGFSLRTKFVILNSTEKRAPTAASAIFTPECAASVRRPLWRCRLRSDYGSTAVAAAVAATRKTFVASSRPPAALFVPGDIPLLRRDRESCCLLAGFPYPDPHHVGELGLRAVTAQSLLYTK